MSKKRKCGFSSCEATANQAVTSRKEFPDIRFLQRNSFEGVLVVCLSSKTTWVDMPSLPHAIDSPRLHVATGAASNMSLSFCTFRFRPTLVFADLR